MPHMANTQTNDFSKGSVAGNILRLALPMTVAQLINVLYSVVDRMYIGRLPDAAGNALTGLGLTFPILSIVRPLPTCSAWAARRCSPSSGAKATGTGPR